MSMRDKLRRVAAVFCCGAAALVAGCSILPVEEEPLKPPLVQPVKENFELYEVKYGSIAKKISGVATFASDKTTYLYFTESGGRLQSINVRLGDGVKAGDVVATLNPGDLETRIRLQELAVEKANIMLDQAKEEQRGDMRALRLKMIDLESAQVQLESLKRQLEKTKLVSDIDGIVTYVEPLNQGDPVEAYRPIVSISDPTEMKLVYQATNPNDLVGVEINMDVAVKIKDREFKGKVVQIPATAPFTENKALQERNLKSIVIRVDDLPEDAEIGTSADFTIITEQRDNVLVIPRSGLRSYLGRDYVQVLEGESRKEVDVEKGIVSSTEVEIRKGLEEGQLVILNN